jgi:hypothetical protein
MSIVTEGAREVLYLTDLQKHKVVKTTLSGEVLQEWPWPQATGKYENKRSIVHRGRCICLAAISLCWTATGATTSHTTMRRGGS